MNAWGTGEEVHPSINNLVVQYAEAKQSLADQLGASEALLHIHVGLLIFVSTALLLRRQIASGWPITVVAFRHC